MTDYNDWQAQQDAQQVIDDNDWEAQEGEEMWTKLQKGFQRQQQKFVQQTDARVEFEEFQRFQKEKNLTPEQIQAMQQRLMQDQALTEKVMRKKHRKALNTAYDAIIGEQGPSKPGQQPKQQQQQADKEALMQAAKERAHSQKGGLRADERHAVLDALLGDVMK